VPILRHRLFLYQTPTRSPTIEKIPLQCNLKIMIPFFGQRSLRNLNNLSCYGGHGQWVGKHV
uniref:Uncharacterized protein n=1 Tax=Pristionchus pacificus TaxID=54126 RepID=A0A2A6CQ69_PRIPA